MEYIMKNPVNPINPDKFPKRKPIFAGAGKAINELSDHEMLMFMATWMGNDLVNKEDRIRQDETFKNVILVSTIYTLQMLIAYVARHIKTSEFPEGVDIYKIIEEEIKPLVELNKNRKKILGQ